LRAVSRASITFSLQKGLRRWDEAPEVEDEMVKAAVSRAVNQRYTCQFDGVYTVSRWEYKIEMP
jgi:hypothetical protein